MWESVGLSDISVDGKMASRGIGRHVGIHCEGVEMKSCGVLQRPMGEGAASHTPHTLPHTSHTLPLFTSAEQRPARSGPHTRPHFLTPSPLSPENPAGQRPP